MSDDSDPQKYTYTVSGNHWLPPREANTEFLPELQRLLKAQRERIRSSHTGEREGDIYIEMGGVMPKESFTDWLGQEVSVGDTVVYPVVSGRSINLVLAKIDKINFDDVDRVKSVLVSLVNKRGSRWQHGYESTRYVDSRTGKGIDPWSGSGKHIKEEGYYVDPDGDMIIDGKYWNEDWRYIPVVFQDWVLEEKVAPKPRTLTVVRNIMKVEVQIDE